MGYINWFTEHSASGLWTRRAVKTSSKMAIGPSSWSGAKSKETCNCCSGGGSSMSRFIAAIVVTHSHRLPGEIVNVELSMLHCQSERSQAKSMLNWNWIASVSQAASPKCQWLSMSLRIELKSEFSQPASHSERSQGQNQSSQWLGRIWTFRRSRSIWDLNQTVPFNIQFVGACRCSLGIKGSAVVWTEWWSDKINWMT